MDIARRIKGSVGGIGLDEQIEIAGDSRIGLGSFLTRVGVSRRPRAACLWITLVGSLLKDSAIHPDRHGPAPLRTGEVGP